MNQGKYVFAQIAQFLPSRVFDRCVSHYDGNKWIKHFTCWNQMMSMMFGQLSGRESLRDLLVCISAHKSKFYHLGFGKNISRSNLANANEKRDYRIYEEFAYSLIAQARISCHDDDFALDIQGEVYAFDSTIINLCLNVFWWAKFRSTKSGIKLHTLYDVKTTIPSFILITNAALNDMESLDELNYEANAFYILDRGYMDFTRLHTIHMHSAYFVTRAKNKLRFKRVQSNSVNKQTGVLVDQIIKLSVFYSRKGFPDNLRRIKFYDKIENKTLVFITNNLKLPAENIALLYKYRWKIELFFKWIKQHLKIKSFWGTSPNAVKSQVYIAIITYTLVALIKSKVKTDLSTYEILQILSVSLLDKTPMNELLTNLSYQDVNELYANQLTMNLI